VLRLLKLAGITKGKNFMVSHRFRDTFAVEYLATGQPIESFVAVSHSSVVLLRFLKTGHNASDIPKSRRSVPSEDHTWNFCLRPTCWR
jgi:hypothetical protein